ncbi:hypothetical protein [Sorangium sp. So ce388]|uniref:hypothetical protein n=1 Tax=Sorangium sp. So ce388 TaxID=3133309 RepID=UPI003F5C5995
MHARAVYQAILRATRKYVKNDPSLLVSTLRIAVLCRGRAALDLKASSRPLFQADERLVSNGIERYGTYSREKRGSALSNHDHALTVRPRTFEV